MSDATGMTPILYEAGGLISPGLQPAFRHSSVGGASIPIVLAVPHAGRIYPDDVLMQMRDPQSSVLKLEDRLVDTLALAIARKTGAALLIADAPRAMIDLNRDLEDVDWGMVRDKPQQRSRPIHANRRARGGLGLVPRRLGRDEIWNAPLPMDELQRRISQIHGPYHDRLSEMVRGIRNRFGSVTLIDLHSMPPLTTGHVAGAPIEFVLGDRFGASCEGEISDAVEYILGKGRRNIVRNRPYAGGYVLDRHANPKQSIHAFQLEICRSLYLDATFEKLEGDIDSLVTLLAEMVREVAMQTIMLGNPPVCEAAQ